MANYVYRTLGDGTTSLVEKLQGATGLVASAMFFAPVRETAVVFAADLNPSDKKILDGFMADRGFVYVRTDSADPKTGYVPSVASDGTTFEQHPDPSTGVFVPVKDPSPATKRLHLEQQYDKGGKLIRATQWRMRVSGVFSLRAQEATYEYQGSRLMTRTEVDYALDGSEMNRTVWAYETGTGANKVLIEEQISP